jgi:serine/threonine-protein kinase
LKRASEESPRLSIGRYELLFELATGGMGRVFVARQLGDAGFERIVALKRVHAHLVSDPDVYGMASDEARLSALVHHPNVVPVIDVVDAKGELVLVMDYVEGVSLGSLLRACGGDRKPDEASVGRPPLDHAVAARILVDTLRGLSAAHAARDLAGCPLELVHRDVSPQNLLVGIDGSTRVIDFGIARAEGRLTHTKTGVIKGKVVYMAPERLEEGEVDRRADLFSAGAVLYELLVGKWAFGSGEEGTQMTRILLGEIDFTELRSLAPHLAPVVERALSRRPRDRFDTAEEFARALSDAQAPAEPEVVAALLIRWKASEIEARRERIAKEIAARTLDAVDEPETDPVVEFAARATEAREPAAQTAVRSRSWVLVALVGALVVNGVGWWVLVRSGATEANAERLRSTTTSTTSPTSTSTSTSTSSSTSTSTSTTTPTSTPTPVLSVSGAGLSAASGVPSGARPGLEPSPYGGDLRKSPYKRP